MIHYIITFIMLFYLSVSNAQVNICVFNQTGGGVNSISGRVNSVYQNHFGIGNVTITPWNNTLNLQNFDIVIMQDIVKVYSSQFTNDLIFFIQNGGHAIISTEGSTISGGGKFMSTVWNAVTGQNISETGAGASGTKSPPRFHNSNGPWGSSPDLSISPTTKSYASFGNLSALNVTHQRNASPPSCGNIEGMSAVFPSKPKMGNGTLYIQGEAIFPFQSISTSISNHINAVALMHYALLTNNQHILDSLNNWGGGQLLPMNDTALCLGNFNSFTVYADSGYSSYSWEDLSGNIISTDSFFMITDTISLIVKAIGISPKCNAEEPFKVRYDQLSFNTQTTNTCSNIDQGSVAINNVTSFSLTPPLSYQLNNNPPSSNNVFNGLTYGNHLVKVSDSRGCFDTTTITIDTLASPFADFEFDTVCLGNTSIFRDISSIAGGGVINQWNWTIDNSNDNNQNTGYTFASYGPHDVRLKVTTVDGCVDSISKEVYLHHIPLVNFSANPSCEFENMNFQNTTTTSGNPFNNNFVFNWQFDDGNASIDQNPIHQYNSAGTFNVTLTAVSDKLCINDTTISVTVNPKPNANFIVDSVCLGSTTSFTDISTVSNGNINSWKWDIANIVSTNQNPTYSFLVDGTFSIQLEIQSDQGCKDTIIKNTIVYPLPTADFTMSVNEIDVVKNRVDFYNNSQGATNYSWTFDTLGNSSSFNPTFYFDIPEPCEVFETKLVAESSFGCKDSTTAKINAKGNLLFYIPNSFTPDNDGVNDIFQPVFTDLNQENYLFQVFDRWGTLIFQTTNIAEGWTGTDNLGNPLKQDIYIWKISGKTVCEIDIDKFSGHVTLLK